MCLFSLCCSQGTLGNGEVHFHPTRYLSFMVHPPHDSHSLPNIPAPSMLPTSVLLASVVLIVHCLLPILHRLPPSPVICCGSTTCPAPCSSLRCHESPTEPQYTAPNPATSHMLCISPSVKVSGILLTEPGPNMTLSVSSHWFEL